MRGALREMVDFNKAEADDSTRKIVSIVRAAELGLIVCFVIAVVLAILCGYLLFRAVTVPLGKLLGIVDHMRQGDFSERLTLARRDEFSTLADGVNGMADDLAGLIGQVQKSSIQVNTSITEVAATSKEQQATANEIAATTTEIGATAKEISATSNELAHTMDEVSAVAEQTATLANGGQAGLARMESTMRQVMEAAGAINAKLAILSEKAGNINQVVTTITKVADQTNLLSLNAAIEAEKAGQYGRGFAVVATEIRRLADQTAVSTYDIEQMVKDIQSAVAAGVMGMDKFSEEVRRGMQEVQQVGGQLSEIIEQVQGWCRASRARTKACRRRRPARARSARRSPSSARPPSRRSNPCSSRRWPSTSSTRSRTGCAARSRASSCAPDNKGRNGTARCCF